MLEVQTQLIIAGRLGFGNAVELESADSAANEVGKMLWALLKKI